VPTEPSISTSRAERGVRQRAFAITSTKNMCPLATRAPSIRDDIGAASSGEIERLRARNEELERENRRLERENAGLRREIEELRARLAPGDPGPIPAFLRKEAP